MNKHTALMALLITSIFLASVAGVIARGDETPCIPQPAQGISVDSIAGGVTYIMAGGVGPILILAVAFIVGLVVSHLVWGGF